MADSITANELYALMMQAPVAFMLFEGEELVARLVNDTALQIMGKTEAEILNKGMSEAFPALPERRNVYLQVYRTGKPYTGKDVEVSYERDGQPYTGYYDLDYQPWYNDAGAIRGVMATGVEVTESVLARRSTEQVSAALEANVKARTAELERRYQELENIRSFLRQLIDSSVEYISVIDNDLRYVTVNRKFEEGIGMTSRQLIGKTLFDINPKAYGTPEHNYILRALEGETLNLNKRQSVALPDNVIDTYFIPLRIQDTIEGVIIMARDITDIVKTERSLEDSNNELKRMNKELESFNYIASHDLQEPLRKIQTFINMLERNTADPAQQQKYIEKINSSSARMSALIRSILEYSRIAHTADAFVQTDLNEALELVKKDYELAIEETQAIITSEPLPTIMAIPVQVQQLFTNLLSNALKFCDKEPRIHISASVKKGAELRPFPGMYTGREYAEIIFTDNGIGFEPEYAEKIFQFFQRLHSKTEYSGTGIGLSIVAKIAAQHKGNITAVSARGEGSSFIIHLPLVQ